MDGGKGPPPCLPAPGKDGPGCHDQRRAAFPAGALRNGTGGRHEIDFFDECATRVLGAVEDDPAGHVVEHGRAVGPRQSHGGSVVSPQHMEIDVSRPVDLDAAQEEKIQLPFLGHEVKLAAPGGKRVILFAAQDDDARPGRMELPGQDAARRRNGRSRPDPDRLPVSHLAGDHDGHQLFGGIGLRHASCPLFFRGRKPTRDRYAR